MLNCFKFYQRSNLMLPTINPYGVGNVYQNPTIDSNVSNPKPTQTTMQEVQELPNLSQNTLEIRRFTDGIKGANEMVGALQIANIALNKLHNAIKDGIEDVTALDAQAKASQFKGEALFGRELTATLGGENVSLSLPLPSQIEGDLGENFTSKQQEISERIGIISGLIEKASLPFAAASAQNFDFENFDPNVLKGIFN